jgi:hypothetical protein
LHSSFLLLSSSSAASISLVGGVISCTGTYPDFSLYHLPESVTWIGSPAARGKRKQQILFSRQVVFTIGAQIYRTPRNAFPY